MGIQGCVKHRKGASSITSLPKHRVASTIQAYPGIGLRQPFKVVTRLCPRRGQLVVPIIHSCVENIQDYAKHVRLEQAHKACAKQPKTVSSNTRLYNTEKILPIPNSQIFAYLGQIIYSRQIIYRYNHDLDISGQMYTFLICIMHSSCCRLESELTARSAVAHVFSELDLYYTDPAQSIKKYSRRST